MCRILDSTANNLFFHWNERRKPSMGLRRAFFFSPFPPVPRGQKFIRTHKAAHGEHLVEEEA